MQKIFSGTLRESYDELGNRYQVPYYCLSAPTNLVEERSSESSGATGNGDGAHASGFTGSNRPGSSTGGGSNTGGELQTLKLRLSTTGEDVSVDCHSRETVHMVKQRLHQTMTETVPVASQQRWFYGGRVLMDKMRIGDCRIPQNFVVQVVIQNNNNAKIVNEETKFDQPADRSASASDRSITVEPVATKIDTMVVMASKETMEENASISTKDINEKLGDSIRTVKTAVQIHSSSITGSSKEQSPPPPPLAIAAALSTGNETVSGGTGSGRRTGSSSSSSRKSHGKQRKLRPHHSSGSSTMTTTTTTTAAANGTSTTSVVLQQRCNSFNSKRSNESPTPVETS